jgi:hypothetical protein
VPPVTGFPPDETFAVIVTIEPLTVPEGVALSVVTVEDCASAVWESKKRQKTTAQDNVRMISFRTKCPSSSARTNDREYFRGLDIFFLEYFS